jgi:integrase
MEGSAMRQRNEAKSIRYRGVRIRRRRRSWQAWVHFDRPEIAILTPDEVRRLLCAARDHAPELVPYLDIAVFAGVRPTELQRLTWEHVNFDLHFIHIGGGISKVRNERYVDMEDVLIRWLEPYRQTSGPVVPQDQYTFTKLFNSSNGPARLWRSC